MHGAYRRKTASSELDMKRYALVLVLAVARRLRGLPQRDVLAAAAEGVAPGLLAAALSSYGTKR